MDANETHREKVSLKLCKNVVRCLEPILQVTPHKTAVVRPLASHLTNSKSKWNKTCTVLLEK